MWEDHMHFDWERFHAEGHLGQEVRSLLHYFGFSDFPVNFLLTVTVVMLSEVILHPKAGPSLATFSLSYVITTHHDILTPKSTVPE